MKTTNKKRDIKNMSFIVVLIILSYVFGTLFFIRFDLTEDKRYTLSPTSLDIINEIIEPLYVDVFLKGNFSPDFKRLQTETRQLLEEFKAYNKNIIFQFVDPLEDEHEADTIIETFYERGLTPVTITMNDKGKQRQELAFPWAIASYKDKSIKVILLKNMMGASLEDNIISSVQHLEYAFSDAFNKIIKEKKKKIVVIKGNNELEDPYLGDILRDLRDSYFIAPFTLDSVAKNPIKTLEELKSYDLAIIAKPTEKFSEEEKLVLDQYIIYGGKILWLMSAVNIETENLYNKTGTSIAFPYDLNLNDLFFKYGFRINPSIIKDIMATPIILEAGGKSQYNQFPWFYAPLIYPNGKHPIINNLDGIRFEYANAIDTLKNNIQKTILLTSSPYSKAVGTPVEINLNMVAERPSPEDFLDKGTIPVAILLEGTFQSAYKNRILPFKEKNYKEMGIQNKMIVISDGNIIRNQLDTNYQPLELGHDKWTNKRYANKEFLLNCINYLLDDNGLINIRSKEVHLALLDKEKVYTIYHKVQWITVGLQLLIVLLFGIIFYYIRKKYYGC